MSKILAVTNLTSRFQTTVPTEVREFLKLSKTDKVVWFIENNQIIVRKA
jgi:bifunctional DNA-binding transcriptional regulator/antitoxin component of YhaV-PrlF toxin-antitoxin module